MVAESKEVDVVVCRACISECVEYKSLHKQGIFLGEIRTLASMLTFITNLDFTIDEDESLPTNICTRCVQKVAKSFAFKQLVCETNVILRKQLSEHECEVDIAEHDAGGGGGVDDVDGNGDGDGDGSVFEDHCTESVDSIVEEQHLDGEDEAETDDTHQLHELAAAAQFKRSVETMEYVALTVLEGLVDGDETEISEVQSQSNLENDEQHCEEVVVHEIVEPEDVYQTDAEEDGRDKDYEEIYEITEIEQGDCSISDNGEEQQQNKALKRPHMIAIKSEEQVVDWDLSGDLKEKPPPIKSRKKNNQTKPPNPALQCKVCGKQLSNPNSFKYHMQLHSDATPYLCSLCGEGFKTRNAYEGHIVIHDPNNPNTCELCGKSYRQSSSLRTHMLSHTGERPFQCDICGKAMTQKSGYKKHMLIHTGEKPHACDICGREFRYSSNLIAHKRCHTGERPYECPHCKRCFPTSEQMKRHSLVHSGERPFQCKVCFKSFKRRSSLMSHHHTHDSEPEVIVDHKVSKSNVVELY